MTTKKKPARRISPKALLKKPLSYLITEFAKDAQAVERSKKYFLRMIDFVGDASYCLIKPEGKPAAKCGVCLGGSMLLRKFGVDSEAKWHCIDSDTSSIAHIGEHIRAGHLGEALYELGSRSDSRSQIQEAAIGAAESILAHNRREDEVNSSMDMPTYEAMFAAAAVLKAVKL